MSVSPVYMGATSAQAAQAPQTKELGQDDFLNLLIAQLKAQDPLDPMESTEFTTQLAQFNSLEQLIGINDNMEDLRKTQETGTNVQAVEFIGKTVKALGGAVSLEEGGPVDMRYELASDAAAVLIDIYDTSGNYVHTLETSNIAAGEQSFEWDGTGGNGNNLPDGDYIFDVSAVDANNEMVPAIAYTNALVTGVEFLNGNAVLLAGGREIPLGSVLRVGD